MGFHVDRARPQDVGICWWNSVPEESHDLMKRSASLSSSGSLRALTSVSWDVLGNHCYVSRLNHKKSQNRRGQFELSTLGIDLDYRCILRSPRSFLSGAAGSRFATLRTYLSGRCWFRSKNIENIVNTGWLNHEHVVFCPQNMGIYHKGRIRHVRIDTFQSGRGSLIRLIIFIHMEWAEPFAEFSSPYRDLDISD